jgi:hypothetical protein
MREGGNPRAEGPRDKEKAENALQRLPLTDAGTATRQAPG